MASLTSTTPRRGVLSELNVNSPIGIASWSDTRKHTGGSENPPRKLGETSLQKDIKGREMSDAVYQEPGLVPGKRDFDSVEGLQVAYVKEFLPSVAEEERAVKRFKTVRDPESLHKSNERGAFLRERPLGSKDDRVHNAPTAPTSPLRNEFDTVSLSLSASVSPASSFASSTDGALNDTQLTEPDEARVVPVLTQGELREKARAIRLRLRLASYKVRTNQINLPMSCLQIKTTKFDLERLPTPRAKVTRPQRRTPLPSAPSNIPNIHLQKPSAEKQRRTDILSSSPPPMLRTASPPANKKFESASPTKEGEEETCEEFATPLLPRHRHGLLNPPNLGSPTWDGKRSPGTDLTSSVVKRGTADVLLSLKLQR